MFGAILDHPLITVRLGAYHDDYGYRNWKHTVFTGPVDEYFGHQLGRLPYRSLRFVHHHRPTLGSYQAAAVVNFPDPKVPWTRITEFKKLTGQRHIGTSYCYEYSRPDGEPYYPVPTEPAQALYRRYEELAERETHTTFIGRLATYKYYNMDQVVAQSLAKVEGMHL